MSIFKINDYSVLNPTIALIPGETLFFVRITSATGPKTSNAYYTALSVVSLSPLTNTLFYFKKK